jgi:riboflavin synthase
MIRIGIVDTMFARADMGAMAMDEIRKHHPDVKIERRTVPGIKDLAVECKRMLDGDAGHETGDPKHGTRNMEQGTGNRIRDAGCDVVLALGMVGGAPIDAQCAHEASLGIQQAKLMTNKHIIEVFVHENEGWSGAEFLSICEDRVRKHAHNAVLIVKDPQALVKKAGKGVRQGREDEGPVDAEEGIMLGIVVADFNSEITTRMERKAIETAGKLGSGCRVLHVPGVFDMPLVASKMLSDKKMSALIALGAVIKGSTAHDEIVAKETAGKLSDLSLAMRKPVALGIIGHGASWDDADMRAEEYAERSVEAAVRLVRVLRS